MRTGAADGGERTIPRPLRVRMRASRRLGLPLLPLLFAVPAAVSALRDPHPEPATFAAVLGTIALVLAWLAHRSHVTLDANGTLDVLHFLPAGRSADLTAIVALDRREWWEGTTRRNGLLIYAEPGYLTVLPLGWWEEEAELLDAIAETVPGDAVIDDEVHIDRVDTIGSAIAAARGRDADPEPGRRRPPVVTPAAAAVLGLAPPADRTASRARRRSLARNVVLPVGFSIAFVALVVLAARWSAGV